MPANPHDALFKWTFSQPEHAAAELRAVLPQAIVAKLDLGSLEVLPGSFVDADLVDRHTDLLYSVPVAGRPGLVYVVFEHQSTSDPLMPVRLLGYMLRVWQRRIDDDAMATLPLPPIIPVVLHHSAAGWSGRTSFHSLVDPELLRVPDLARLVPSFDFVLDDVSHLSDDQIKDRALGAFASLVLWALRDARTPERLLESLANWGQALTAVIRAPDGVQALEALFRYTSLVAGPLPLDRLRTAMSNAAPEAEPEIITLAELFERQGRQEERRAWVLRLLESRFGPLPEATKVRVQNAPADELDVWAERVLDAKSLDDAIGH